MKIDYSDTLEIQRTKNSIAEGEAILKSGKTASGRKMSQDELEAVQRSVNNSRLRIGLESI